ncbi:hypothetical protein VN1217_02120 [Helicobacter pylori]|nr:hypothetical protein VN1217_02120 [Helicobacter pylori]
MPMNISVEPSKIVLFLDDLIKSIGNKDLENLSSLRKKVDYRLAH